LKKCNSQKEIKGHGILLWFERGEVIAYVTDSKRYLKKLAL